MPLNSTSEAAAVGSSAVNTQFAPSTQGIPGRIVVIANYDSVGKTDIVENTLYRVLSSEAAGALFEFGFAAHRLVRAGWRGSQGVPMYVLPQDNDAAGAAATGTVTITATSSTAGTIYLYISGDLVQITVAKALAATAIGDLIETAVNADTNLPVTALNVVGVVTLTSKDLNIEANNIPVKVNLVEGQETPEGVAIAIADMGSVIPGAGIMLNDMETALKVLGEGDNQNEDFYTEVIQGWGVSSAVLDDISEYNGEGNDTTGNWSKTVHRPFRTIAGDIAVDSTGLTAILAVGAARRTLDRTNGVVSVPGSANNPNEIAATVVGMMARFNQDDPNRNLNGTAIPGVFGGVGDDNWSRDYDSRNDAVLSGVSPTLVDGGAVKLQNVLTFYHPTSVSRASNGYKSQFSISKIRYVIHNNWLNFNAERWKGVTIVDDITKVGNSVAKLKVKDTKAVLGELVALTKEYESDAVLFQAQWTIDKLKDEPTRIVLRSGTDGWDINYPILLSGEVNIIDERTEFDTSVTVLQEG